MNILLSPLGLSPGAVSSLYHALEDEGTHVDRIITVSSSTRQDPKTNLAVLYLAEYLKSNGFPYAPTDESGKDRDNRQFEGSDLIQEREVFAFMGLVEQALQDARAAGDRVYLGIAGGRKSMAALATIAAQLHGVEALYHLWVDEEIEKWGTVDELRKLDRNDERRKNVFRPPRERYQLVHIPFLSLAAYRDDFERLLRGVPGFVSPIAKALAERLSYVDAAGNVTPQGQEIARLIQTPIRGVGYLADIGIDENGRVFDEERLLEAIRASCPAAGRRAVETSLLELKSGSWKNPAFMYHLLHAICAFANGDTTGKNRGGVLALGIPDSFDEARQAGARQLREDIAANLTDLRDLLLKAMLGKDQRAFRPNNRERQQLKLPPTQSEVCIHFTPGFEPTVPNVALEHALRAYPAERIGLEGGSILVVIVRPNLGDTYYLCGQDFRRQGSEKIRGGAYETTAGP